MSLLDGAPGFVLLGFIMALAAYMRQVAIAGQKLIDELQGNCPTAYPYQHTSAAVRAERLAFLQRTRRKLACVTQALFVMMFLLSLRMVLFSATRIWPVPPSTADQARFWFDFLFVVALLALICGMWYMHTVSRGFDEVLRNRAVAAQLPGSSHGEA